MTLKPEFFREICLVLGAILFGVVLNMLLLHQIKQSVISDFEGIEFYVPADSDFNSTLYYSFSSKFLHDNKLQSKNDNTKALKFNFPKTDALPTNFRLDFGNDSLANLTTIDSMAIIYKSHTTMLNQEELFGHIILNSAAIHIDKNERSLSFNSLVTGPFDPHIIFDPLIKIVLDHHPLKWMVLIGPFLVLIVISLKRRLTFSEIKIVDILCIVFIICIPLKIAWTTFIALLICAYTIFLGIREKKFDFKNPDALLLLAFFLVLVIFGRPTSLKVIDHQLALIIFYFVIASARFNWQLISRFYIYFILLLNSALVTSGILFLISFKEVFGLGVSEYFLKIKTFSGNIREWLYYDHAVFLTFFGLVGLLFIKELVGFKKESKGLVVCYHILLLSTIVLVGARISLFIYLVFIANIIIETKPKSRILANTGLFLAALTLLFSFISSIDQVRSGLWSVSWEAIKEKPLLGYGLGSSDQVIHQEDIMQMAQTQVPILLNHSHNQFLTFVLEIGFIGTIILVLFIIIYFKQGKRYKNMTMVLFIFGLCYVFLTESILQTSKPLFVLCFLFAIITRMPKIGISNELDYKA